MDKPSNKKKIAIFIVVSAASFLLSRYASLSVADVPGVIAFYFAVTFMIPFALWFGVWGVIAAYIGCVIGAGIPAGLPLPANLCWSLADVWQVLIPLAAFLFFKANLELRTRRDFAVFVGFGVLLNNLAGALWGSAIFVLSGQFSTADFPSLLVNWFLGNIVLTIIITPLLLRGLTPLVKKKGLFIGKT